MKRWTKFQYGTNDNPKGGRWTITDGQMHFDVHLLINGSHSFKPGSPKMFVTHAQADEYADKIVNALNKADVKLTT